MSYDLAGIAEQVRQILAANPRLPLSSISERLHVERHTVEKAVRSACGCSFQDLRGSVLLQESQHLLVTRPNLSVKEIALALGYESGRAFARCFKNVSGASPSEFRKRRRVSAPPGE